MARGLNTVASRIAKNGEALAQYGVSIRDENNELRSTYDILVDLKPQWDIMSQAEKVALGTTLAGVNQYKVFSAVMTQMNTAVDAYSTAMNSSGSAMRENEKFMESLEAKTQRFKTELQDLILGDGGLVNFAKTIVDLGVKIVQFAQSDLGKAVIGITSITTVCLLLLSTGDALIAKLVLLKAKVLELGASLSALEIHPAIIAITALIAVIGGLTVAINYWSNSQERAKEKISELNQEIDKSDSYINKLKSDIEELNKSITELSKKESPTLADEEQLSLLRSQRFELESILKIEEERRKRQQEEYEKTAKKILGGTEKVIVGTDNETQSVEVANLNIVQQLEHYSSRLIELREEQSKYSEELEELDAVIKENGSLTDKQSSRYQFLKDSLYNTEVSLILVRDKLINLSDTIRDAIENLDTDSILWQIASAALKTYADALGQTDEEIEANTDFTAEQQTQLDELIAKYPELEASLEDIKDQMIATGMSAEEAADYLGLLKDETEENANSAEELAKAWADAIAKFNFASATIDGLTDSFDKVKQALKEYNSEHYITLDTYDDLMSLSDEYINLLFDETGALNITTDAQKTLTKAKIDQMAIDKAIALIGTAQKYLDEKGSLEGLSAQLKQTTGDTWDFVASELARLSVNKHLTKADIEEIYALQRQVEMYKTWADSAKKGIDTISTITKNVDKNTDSVKKNTDSVEDASKALDNLADSYKTVISYIEDKVEEQIDILEKQRDEELKVLEETKDAEIASIEERIDLLKDQKEAYTNSTKAQLDELKQKKDAENDYWKNQIDELKKSNEKLKEQAQLQTLLDNLAKAKAKRIKVYKEGEGFVYDVDQSAIETAQLAIDEYKKEQSYNNQLEALENYQKSAEESYEKQIDDLEKKQEEQEQLYDLEIEKLENQITELEKNYDLQVELVENKWNKQIDYYKNWLIEFKKGTDSYETEQKRLQALELTGIDFEKEGWQTRLGNLSEFVANYTALLEQLGEAQKESSKITESTTGVDGTSSISTPSTEISNGSQDLDSEDIQKVADNQVKTKGYVVFQVYRDESAVRKKVLQLGEKDKGMHYKYEKYGDGYYIIKKDNDYFGEYRYGTRSEMNALIAQKSKATGKKFDFRPVGYATGISSIGSDQVALVGESPNQELVLGNKANGTLMNLRAGSGVVNASSTKTLAGIFNQLANFSESNFGNGRGILNDFNSNNNSMNIQIGNISLPSVQNGNDFIEYLQNFSLDMTRKAYT